MYTYMYTCIYAELMAVPVFSYFKKQTARPRPPKKKMFPIKTENQHIMTHQHKK